MIDKNQDPILQAPQESNTTKHINFRETEEADNNNRGNDTSGDEDDSPTKKSWEELRNENNVNHQKADK